MSKINKIFTDIILQVAREKLCCKRKRNYSLEYYLKMFCVMSNDVVKWKSLKLLKDYKPKKENLISDKGFHYKSIQNEFSRWANLNIFLDAHNRYLKKYYYILKPHLKKLNINLYIDTTYIWNKYGVEYIGIHPEYKKKNATKLGSLVDEDGDILSIIHFIINETIVTNEITDEYEYTKHTFNHDVTIIQELFNNVIVHFDKRKTIKCGGDKAFITNDNISHNNKKVIMVTPKRERSNKQTKKLIKNKQNIITITKLKIAHLQSDQKRYLNGYAKIVSLENDIQNFKKVNVNIHKYDTSDNKMFSKRYKVEDNYLNLKKSERILIRKDKKIATYMSFVYMNELNRLIKKYYQQIIDNELFTV